MGRSEALKERIAPLDGLRGLAALVVVVFHALLCKGEILAANGTGIGDEIAVTPFAFLVSGGSAVVLFFVLSGFVLERSVRNKSSENWKPWLAARLSRLYFPIWPVLFLYVSYLNLFQPTGVSVPSAFDIVADSTLVLGHGGILGVLWTLRWEIIFSLLIPVLARFGPTFAVGRIPTLALLICTSVLGNLLNVGAIQYLPMCIAGFSLSRILDGGGQGRLDSGFVGLFQSTSARPWIIATGLLLCGAEMQFLVSAGGWEGRTDFALVVGQMLALVGAILLVASFAAISSDRSPLSKTLSWFGEIPFSIYLVHQPCLELVNRYLTLPTSVSIAVGILSSVVVAATHGKFVERPLQQLSKTMKGHS